MANARHLNAALDGLVAELEQRCLVSPEENKVETVQEGFLLRDVVLFRFEGHTFVLTGEARESYLTLTRGLAGDREIGEISSLAGVQKGTKEMLRAALTDVRDGRRRRPSDYLTELHAGLRGQVVDWTVVAPVVGVQLEDGVDVQLGAVRMVRTPSDEVHDILHEFEVALARCEGSPAVQGMPMGQFLTAAVDSARYSTCAYVKGVCVADGEKALDSGVALLRGFVATLQAFLFAVHRDPLRPRLGVPPDGDLQDPQLMVFRASAVADGAPPASGYTGPKRVDSPFTLNDATLERLNQLGWARLSEVWQKPETTDWEKTLRTAARWLGDALSDENSGAAFAKFTTVLEVLLAQDGQTRKIRGPLARRLAYLLVRDAADSSDLERRAKKLYDTRCSIVHQGYTGVTEDDLDAVRSFSVDAFVSLLTRLDEIDSFERLVALSGTEPVPEADCRP